jgi:hypothetical protein
MFLRSKKAVAYQLKRYCMGMNQLIDLSKMKDATASLKQSELLERMKATIGVAVSTMERHIKAGTVCPLSADEGTAIKRTLKTRNSSVARKLDLSASNEKEKTEKKASKEVAIGGETYEKKWTKILIKMAYLMKKGGVIQVIIARRWTIQNNLFTCAKAVIRTVTFTAQNETSSVTLFVKSILRKIFSLLNYSLLNFYNHC